ncbi:DUF6774 domain-containing protein [Oscillospiraceae bacterium MB08-C2-2]|nr:DUF6774 domain-containing protein [Oscillospiraceae bacterium MB08-C2-2]
MSQLKCVSGERLAYLATTFAVAIAQDLDMDDVNILSSFFSAIGDSLGIIASQRSACADTCQPK